MLLKVGVNCQTDDLMAEVVQSKGIVKEWIYREGGGLKRIGQGFYSSSVLVVDSE